MKFKLTFTERKFKRKTLKSRQIS